MISVNPTGDSYLPSLLSSLPVTDCGLKNLLKSLCRHRLTSDRPLSSSAEIYGSQQDPLLFLTGSSAFWNICDSAASVNLGLQKRVKASQVECCFLFFTKIPKAHFSFCLEFSLESEHSYGNRCFA